MIVRMIRKGWTLAAMAGLVATLFSFLASGQYQTLLLAFRYWDPVAITDYRLALLSNADFISEIETSVADGDIEGARDLVGLAEDFGHKLPEDLIARTQETTIQFGIRNSKDFFDGAVTGNARSMAAIMGTMASDYAGIGDARDLVVQGSFLVQGEDYDKLTLGLAAFGLVTVVPGSGAADATASVVKTAHKAGRLSKPLREHVARLATRVVDVQALKIALADFSLPKLKIPSLTVFQKTDWSQVAKGDFSSVGPLLRDRMPIDLTDAKKSFSGTIRSEHVLELKTLAGTTSGIVSSGGIRTGFLALENADNLQDLTRFRHLAESMGDRTAAAIRMLGKKAIHLAELIYLIAAVVTAVVVWIITLGWFLWRIARALVHRPVRA